MGINECVGEARTSHLISHTLFSRLSDIVLVSGFPPAYSHNTRPNTAERILSHSEQRELK